MRVVYFGSGGFGLPTLRRLVKAHDVALVVTQPDRPAGRRRRDTPTPVGEFAASNGIPALKPENVNDPEVVRTIRAEAADAFVVIAFGQKLGPDLLEGVFAINLHGSLLPKYRGAAPVNWALIQGEKTTGLSVITLAERMDAGEVLGQVQTPINPMETAGELHDRLAELGPDIVCEVLDRFRRGQLTAERQDESRATRAPKLSKSHGTVRFDQPAEAVRARVHGLTPWPGCRVRVNDHAVRLHRVKVVDADTERPETPGALVDGDCVVCRPGVLRLLAVHPPGGKLMSFDAYRRGHDLPEDAILRPMEHETQERPIRME